MAQLKIRTHENGRASVASEKSSSSPDRGTQVLGEPKGVEEGAGLRITYEVGKTIVPIKGFSGEGEHSQNSKSSRTEEELVSWGKVQTCLAGRGKAKDSPVK